MNPLTLLDEADTAAARKTRHLAMLAELAEIGMTLARLTGERTVAAAAATQAAEAAAPEPGAKPSGSGKRLGELGRVFSGLARCVRQTLALEAKIAANGFARAVDWERRELKDPAYYNHILLGMAGSGGAKSEPDGAKPSEAGATEKAKRPEPDDAAASPERNAPASTVAAADAGGGKKADPAGTAGRENGTKPQAELRKIPQYPWGSRAFPGYLRTRP